MTSLKSLTFNAKLFYVLVLGVFVAILMRNSALYPSIFADEYTYSTYSRLLPFSQSPISNYLYLLTFRLTNLCGDGFLSCARLLNTLFFILTCPFIYQTAKRISSKATAKYIAVLSLIGPINIYTANFMPEAMYFLAFWIYAWYILGLNSFSSLKSWFGVGVLIGVCMLIKPHGAFLLISTSLYLVILFAIQKTISFKRMVYCAFLMIGGTFITKLLIGFCIAGVPGLNILGHLYATSAGQFITAASSVADTSQIASEASSSVIASKESFSIISHWLSGLPALLTFWAINLRGHLLGLVLLYGLPLLVMVRILKGSIRLANTKVDVTQNLVNGVVSRYAWFTFLTGTSLVLLSSLFSGFISLAYSGEILRMHMRYYNFTFPLLLMLLPFIFFDSKENEFTKKINISEWLIWALITFIALWSFWKIMAPYQPTAIDTPELKGLMHVRGIYYALTGLAVLCLLIWPIYKKNTVKLFFWVVTPLLLIGGSIGVNQNIWQHSKPDSYDRAGMVIKNLLSNDEISKLVVVGDNPIELSRVLFYLDNPKASSQIIPGNTTYKLSMMPRDKTRVLLMDGHPIDSSIQNPLHFDGYILAGGSGSITLNFQSVDWHVSKHALFNSIGLFTPPESWGAWSIDKVVILQFKQALPEAFTLSIDARAFGPNINKPIALQVGNTRQTFSLGGIFEKKVLKIKNIQRASEVKMIIPAPTSPKELRLGEDERLLGVGIKSIEITW